MREGVSQISRSYAEGVLDALELINASLESGDDPSEIVGGYLDAQECEADAGIIMARLACFNVRLSQYSQGARFPNP